MVQATEYLYIVRDDEILHGEPIIKGSREQLSKLGVLFVCT